MKKREDARAPEERRREDGRNEPGGGSRRGRDSGHRAASLGPTFRRADRRPRPRGRRKRRHAASVPSINRRGPAPSLLRAASSGEEVVARRVREPCEGGGQRGCRPGQGAGWIDRATVILVSVKLERGQRRTTILKLSFFQRGFSTAPATRRAGRGTRDGCDRATDSDDDRTTATTRSATDSRSSGRTNATDFPRDFDGFREPPPAAWCRRVWRSRRADLL